MKHKKSRVSEVKKAFKKGLIAKNKKSSLVADSGRKAKPAGRRISASGSKYTENRPNRSDVSRRKMPFLQKGGKIRPANKGGFLDGVDWIITGKK
jgi:hypothetical protein